MKDLKQYLAESERVYEFRMKIAREPSDKELDSIELHLRKYDAFDIETPKKMVIQRNPRDFRGMNAVEVYYVDFKTRQPVTSYILRQEFVQRAGIPENLIVVRNKAEPLHIEDEVDDVEDVEYTTRLMDPDYKEAEKVDVKKLYGEDFKSAFLKTLEKSRVDLNKEVKK